MRAALPGLLALLMWPVVGRAEDAARAGVARGVAYLVRAQNADGSWGSARRTKDLNIYAPSPGSHHAFRMASSALCVSALLETPGAGEPAREALGRGLTYLLARHRRVRRPNGDTLYNVWAHAYLLAAFGRATRQGPEARRAACMEAARWQLKMLERYQTVQGGWGYFDFDYGARRSAGDAMSFTTATALVAIDRARRVGLVPSPATIDRAVRVVRVSRKPDGSYVYSFPGLFKYPLMRVNRIKGSLTRTMACNLALRLFAPDGPVDARWVGRGFENLWQHQRFVDVARKRPVPHEAWYQNSGYYFYYGYYYAARLLLHLPEAARAGHARRVIRELLARQEKTGAWWDYPLYDYHKPYGTGYALLALASARRALE